MIRTQEKVAEFTATGSDGRRYTVRGYRPLPVTSFEGTTTVNDPAGWSFQAWPDDGGPALFVKRLGVGRYSLLGAVPEVTLTPTAPGAP